MAGYVAIEAAIQTILQGQSADFASDDVVLGDHFVLDRGSAPYAILLKVSGPKTLRRGGDGTRFTAWRLALLLITEYTTPAASRAASVALVDRTYQRLESYPTLNNLAGVTSVEISAEGEPEEVRPEGAEDGTAPYFLAQELSIEVVEAWQATGGQYA